MSGGGGAKPAPGGGGMNPVPGGGGMNPVPGGGGGKPVPGGGGAKPAPGGGGTKPVPGGGAAKPTPAASGGTADQSLTGYPRARANSPAAQRLARGSSAPRWARLADTACTAASGPAVATCWASGELVPALDAATSASVSAGAVGSSLLSTLPSWWGLARISGPWSLTASASAWRASPWGSSSPGRCVHAMPPASTRSDGATGGIVGDAGWGLPAGREFQRPSLEKGPSSSRFANFTGLPWRNPRFPLSRVPGAFAGSRFAPASLTFPPEISSSFDSEFLSGRTEKRTSRPNLDAFGECISGGFYSPRS